MAQAVILSSYVPNEFALGVATDYLKELERTYGDCDIYVGINTGAIPAWEQALNASPLKITLAHVPAHLSVDSDAAGFQAALRLLRDQGKEYELVWFAHTKGASTDRTDFRHHLIHDFLRQRRRIAQRFAEPRLGSYAYNVTAVRQAEIGRLDRELDDLYKFPYRAVGLYYLYTFYVLRGSLVHQFVHGCDEAFFTKNLVSDLEFDRYYFERNFAALTEKMGYYPMYSLRHTHLSEVTVSRQYLRDLIEAWAQQLPAADRRRLRYP